MPGEKIFQCLEELHQPRGDILRHRQIGRERQPRLQSTNEAISRKGMLERLPVSGMPYAQVTLSDRIDLLSVKLEEVAVLVDEHHTLVTFLGEGVVADGVVCEVVKDLEGEEVAGRADVDVPIENGLVDDLDVSRVATSGSGGGKLGGLTAGQGGGYFDNFKLGTFIDFRVDVADVVEDVEHECSVPGAEFIDDEVVEWVVSDHVVDDEVAGYCFAVVWTKEFCGCVP